VFFAREGGAGATKFDEELTAEDEKLGGAKEAKEGEVGLEALSKIMLEDSTERGRQNRPQGKVKLWVQKGHPHGWFLRRTKIRPSLKKDGVPLPPCVRVTPLGVCSVRYDLRMKLSALSATRFGYRVTPIRFISLNGHTYEY
jgi:hypothetical protein